MFQCFTFVAFWTLAGWEGSIKMSSVPCNEPEAKLGRTRGDFIKSFPCLELPKRQLPTSFWWRRGGGVSLQERRCPRKLPEI